MSVLHASATLRVLCLLAFVCQSLQNEEFGNVKVTCGAGTFIGNKRNLTIYKETYQINQFLGIPFAEPPVGERRFRKPERIAPLSVPYDATKYGASCHGLYFELSGARKNEPIEFSEDCLFLNILIPKRKSEDEKLPVMMWIHGGGFNSGTSTMYPNEVITAVGNVVHVSINYRQAAWGFLSTGDDVSSGNYGLWDQHIAIQWIHDNIAAFGGDPERFTIYGYSAGSASVVYQSMFPGNEGLFQRAIAMSGSVTCPWAFTKDPMTATRKLGSLIECDQQDSKELYDCIKSKPNDVLVAALNKDGGFVIFPMEFVTAVDGDFIKHPPSELINANSENGKEERRLLSDRDFMAGITTNEGLMMITSFVGVHNTEGFTINQHEFRTREIPKISKIMFGEGSSEVTEQLLMSEYFPWDDPDNDTAVREAFLRLSSDYTFGIHAISLINARKFQEDKNTFFYVFDAKPSQHILQAPTWSDRPTHCDDLTFLFGYDTDFGYGRFTMPYTTKPPADWEVELSKAEITMWTNFARTGNPNLPDDIQWYTNSEWPKFTRDKQEYFHISRKMSQPTAIKRRPLAKAFTFWNETKTLVVEASRSALGQQYCPRPEHAP